MKKIVLITLCAGLLFATVTSGQKKSDAPAAKNDPWKSETFNGLKFRSIGPALTSGRVVDFAVDRLSPKHIMLLQPVVVSGKLKMQEILMSLYLMERDPTPSDV